MMRLAGTVNDKTGAYARILEADFALPAYPIEALVGDLPDPAPATVPARRRDGVRVAHRDPYKRISPPEYFEQLAGIDVPPSGLVSCPAAWHDDRHPSCSVGTSASPRLVLPRRLVRRARRDLRPRLGPARRARTAASCAARRSSAPARYVADVFGDPT